MAEQENSTTPHEPLMVHASDDWREHAILRKVALRLMPFLCLLYLFNILDRNNVSFAKLRMQDDLGMTEDAYAFGAGMFFIGYFVFQVPSNLILNRIGARRWLAIILIAWGSISTGMLLVTGRWSFIVLRFLLGFAEAGFFPGILLYLTYWFPAKQRARAAALFLVASPLVLIAGGPLSGAVMQYMHQLGGLAGWQWLFLVEGAPAVVLGVIALYYLTDRPDQANWLTADEKSWLSGKIAGEEKHREEQHGLNLAQTLMDARVWRLILLYFTIAGSIAGLSFYLPTFIKDRFPGRQEFTIGLLTAVPGLVAIVAMVLVSISSDRKGERRWHVAGCAAFGAIGWGLYAILDAPIPSLLALALAQAAMFSALAPFWALPAAFLSGRAAAGGIALINAFGNLGGFAAPYILARLYVPNGKYVWGIVAIVTILIIGAALAVSVRREPDHRKTA